MAERKKPHVHPVDEAWLALGEEQPVAPQIEIVDSHIHLWDFSDPPYFVDSYERDAQAAGIVASVYVDCTMAYRESGPDELASVGEVEFAAQQAELAPGGIDIAAAIIGWADLALGDDVAPVLHALEQAGRGRFRGVRSRATYDPDPKAGYGDAGVRPGLMADPAFRRGVACLDAHRHVLDLYAFHTQLHEVADLARAFPDLPIVLNHIGGPLGVGPYAQDRDGVFRIWAAGIDAVGQCPNIHLKVGGFAISRIAIVPTTPRERPFESGQVADLCRPWVDHALAAFGADRCLFGSNFPVDKVAMPLLTLVNAMKLLTAGLGIDGQRKFFADNARALYRI